MSTNPGDQTVTELTALTAPVDADLVHVIDDVAGTPKNKKVLLSDLKTYALDLTPLTALTTSDAADLLHITDDVAGTPTSKKILVSDLMESAVDAAHIATALVTTPTALSIYPQTSAEEDRNITPISHSYLPGDAFRYMTAAQITDVLTGAKTLDVTVAINNAIQSGHGAYITGGTPAISDTVILDGDKSLSLNNNVTIERLGSSTAPLFHLYGNANALVGTGQARIKNELYDHPHGIILVGVHPTDAGGTSDVPTRGFTVRGLKVFGPVGTVENGSPGIYLHSGARRGGGNTSVCYKGVLINNEIRNCDVGLEFSTDANSHYVSGLYVTRWINAALWFNGAYGNVINGVMMEFAEIAITPNNDKRYAIQFNKQNSGVETGTDASYFADAAFDNSVSGYAELTNGTGGNVNRNIALLLQNEDGSTQGNNDVHIMGTLSGGIGLAGNSTAETDVGTTNTIETVNGLIHNRKRWRAHGHQFRKADDDSGTIRYKDSTCWLTDHHSSVTDTSTQGDFFSWDNIQDAGRVSVKIEIGYACKVDGTTNTQAGNIIWVARLHANSTYTSSKIFDVSDALGGTRILELNITLAAGGNSNSMKVTVGFLSGSTGTKWAIGWDAKISTSSTGSNIDWDGDIKFL